MFKINSTLLNLFRPTPLTYIAHWFCGPQYRHRFMREKRYHPNRVVASHARNRFSWRRSFKTNRWNYKQAYRDMPESVLQLRQKQQQL